MLLNVIIALCVVIAIFVVLRFLKPLTVILLLCVALGVCIIGAAGRDAYVDDNYWDTVYNKYYTSGLPEYPVRGGIYSADGKLLVANLPQYEIIIDFRVDETNRQDMIRRANGKQPTDKQKKLLIQDNILDNPLALDTICEGLARITARSASDFRSQLLKGKKQRSRYFRLLPYGKRFTFSQYKALRKLPLFREPDNRSGVIVNKFYARQKPYGSLASVLIGDVDFDDKNGTGIGKRGLEQVFNDTLAGIAGEYSVEMIGRTRAKHTTKEVVNGSDIITTIDISLQDMAEKALRERLETIEADKGYVIIMEASTGDVKAMVNLEHVTTDNSYRELLNRCLIDRIEPGSTFKTASLMVALDEGKVKITDQVNRLKGIKAIGGKRVSDTGAGENIKSIINVPEILAYSSNIGTGELIHQNYRGREEDFVKGLNRVGMGIDLQLPFKGVPPANLSRSYWSDSDISRVAFGYSTEIPPISTVSFYNAIANDGRFMQPRFVSAVRHTDGTTTKLPTRTLIEQICKPQTLKEIRDALYQVVYHTNSEGRRDGTGKPVVLDELQPKRNSAGDLVYEKTGKAITAFQVSGKTGTARVIDGKGGYASGKHFVSFCGYFPSAKPQYTMLVAIQIGQGVQSGGMMAGGVFKEIALSMFAKGLINTQ